MLSDKCEYGSLTCPGPKGVGALRCRRCGYDFRGHEIETLRSQLDAALLQVGAYERVYKAALAYRTARGLNSTGQYAEAIQAAWVELTDAVSACADGTQKRSDPAPKFTGIAKCPKCGTEGLENESGIIEAPQFYTKPVVCEVCKKRNDADPYRQPKTKDILGMIPDLPEIPGTSPTERPCCVEAYARGWAVGKEQAKS